MSDHGYAVEIPVTYDEAVIRTRLALRGEGFSILTESHVGGMLGPQAGDERQYLFMAAWNTGIADETDAQVRVALNLPCNVVVQEKEPVALVAALDPLDSVDPFDDRSITVAETARAALTRAFDRIKQDA